MLSQYRRKGILINSLINNQLSVSYGSISVYIATLKVISHKAVKREESRVIYWSFPTIFVWVSQ